MGGDVGRASHIGHHDCYTEKCVRFFWWHGVERDNMTFQRMLIVYRLWESGLCACALARCIPHKCVSVLFWRELPLGPPWPNIPYRLCPRLWWLHVCKLFYLFNFFPKERRKNPLSGPKFRLDNTKGLWGLSCVSVSDFDQYNNPHDSLFTWWESYENRSKLIWPRPPPQLHFWRQPVKCIPKPAVEQNHIHSVAGRHVIC